jgi:hypothetical protein
MMHRSDSGAAQAGEVIVVGPQGLRSGDEIVGIQWHGESDEVRQRRERIVEVVGEHPGIGSECI